MSEPAHLIMVQSNLVNLNSSELDVLFWIISSSSYRESDIKYKNSKIIIIIFSIKYKFWVRKRNVS